MSKAKARVFVPLTKVDEEKRLVYGQITQEILDKSGEVMDYETSKPFFEKWSNDIHEASNGLSKGNVRVMHGLTAAGKLTELDFNDAEKAIDVCAKIVDDTEWNKVVEGVYTGFSVGGSYAKRWTDTLADGSKVKKFTANPNEVSIVDNPCVPSSTFVMFKADGAEEQVEFKVENDDEAWPDFAKADGEKPTPPVEEQPSLPFPTNDEVVAKATEMAKAAGNGTTWMDHVTQARDELMKVDTALSIAAAQQKDAKEAEGEGTEEEAKTEVDANKGPEASTADADAGNDKATKATPAGVMQKWTTSDGQAFEKKADAIKHEESLKPVELTPAQVLEQRMSKALSTEPVESEPGLIEDFDRLSKAVSAIVTPFEDGKPKLEKGMYTINRFSSVLSDMASLSRTIKREATKEGDDGSDSAISGDIIAAVKTLGASFITYATEQVTELLAGMDDEVLVECYDYYYAAAKDKSDNELAKDVCSLIEDKRDSSREKREELTKAFGIVEADVPVETDELSPPLQKRFDDLTAENEELKKVATTAVEKVEELAKRVQAVEETPLPRAPRNVALREGDGQFFGKAVTSDADKAAIIKEMLETHGPDGMATMMIKAAQQNGHQLSLKS
jgi:hypothetical protein